MTRILVTGNDRYASRPRLHRILAPFANRAPDKPSPHKLIHGGTSRIDELVDAWAKANGVPVRVFLPNPKYGLGAKPTRNKFMVFEGQPDLVLCFGTAMWRDICILAREESIRVREVYVNNRAKETDVR